MGTMNKQIARVKIGQIKAATQTIEKILNSIEKFQLSPNQKYNYIKGIEESLNNSVQLIEKLINDLNFDEIPKELITEFTEAIFTAQAQTNRFESIVRETLAVLYLSGDNEPEIILTDEAKASTKAANKPGRAAARKDTELGDYLINCNKEGVTTALINDNSNVRTSTYLGCVLLALYDLGFIEFKEARKNYIYALCNTLKVNVNIRNVQKFVPENNLKDKYNENRPLINAIERLIKEYSTIQE